ncbi:PP2C family protein-serine/threonine phosphatase [Streptomyces sp. NPDC049585]|uniref:PP2C family protein-serine/threonine phosphatase n=1 Tax=Streptomyces sp. NPDC049585 TaxID=3155154 RepID=UPI0034291880
MTTPHPPKVAGINPPAPAPAHTSSPAVPGPPAAPEPGAPPAQGPPADAPAGPSPARVVQDRLAGWVSDLTTLQELTERLSRTAGVEDALGELLRAGASLVGAGRGLVTLHPAAAHGHPVTVGLGLGHADLGHIETLPAGGPQGSGGPYAGLLDDLPPVGDRSGTVHPDIPHDSALDPRHREVAARLGYAASYALPLESAASRGEPADPTAAGRIGGAVWLYDEPAEPDERQRHLAGLYCGYATEHLARLIELDHARQTLATLREELLPRRLPRVPGVRLAVRHHPGADGGGAWYDALPLPEGALGLAIGAVTDSGPGAIAAMGRLRASLRAYAVMEGEDPVAVLSDLELLLRLTEPHRTATALFAYCEPAERKVVVAGAGHCAPLIVGGGRVEYVDTTLSAPLGMLACWEAPSVEIEPAPGETLLFYSDGLLRRAGGSADRAFARLHRAAASVPRAARHDPEAVADHVLRAVLPKDAAGAAGGTAADDMVLLVAHFD